MLEDQKVRIERERTRQSNTSAQLRRNLGDWMTQYTLQVAFPSKLFDSRTDCVAQGIELERKRDRQILGNGEGVEQDDPIGDQPESIEKFQPFGAVRNCAGGAAEYLHGPVLRERRASGQIDERLGSRRIKIRDRHTVTGIDDEIVYT
jgi:hypothetical protein